MTRHTTPLPPTDEVTERTLMRIYRLCIQAALEEEAREAEEAKRAAADRDSHDTEKEVALCLSKWAKRRRP